MIFASFSTVVSTDNENVENILVLLKTDSCTPFSLGKTLQPKSQYTSPNQDRFCTYYSRLPTIVSLVTRGDERFVDNNYNMYFRANNIIYTFNYIQLQL